MHDASMRCSTAALTETDAGFAATDVVLFCKEAAMRPLRRIMKQLEGGDGKCEKVVLGPVTVEDCDSALKVCETTHGRVIIFVLSSLAQRTCG